MAKDSTATIIFKGDDQISPAIKGATASVAGLSQSFAGVSDASNKTAAEIRKELISSIQSVAGQLGSLSKQKITPEIQLKQDNLRQQLTELQNKLKGLNDTAIKPKIEIDPESLLKSQLQAQALGQLIGKLNELKSASLDAFGAFKTAQRNAAAQATDITGLSAAVKGLGADLKNQVSATELLDNASKVAQKGYRETVDNINVLRATQKLAIATNTDFNTALEATTDILKAYNLPSSEADKVTAQLAATARLAGTSVGELAPQVGRIAITASSAGVSINDLLGFLGKAAKQGADSKTSLAALNKVINDLSTGDLAKKGQEIGISFNEAAIKTGGLNELFKELRDQEISTADGLQKLGFNAKESAAIAPSLASGINQITDAQAELNKQFETQIDPKKSAENQLKDSLVDLGKTVAPIANQVVLLTRNMVISFTQLPDPIKVVLGTLLGTGGLIASVGLLGTSIIEGVKIIGLAVQGLKAYNFALIATNISTSAATIKTALLTPVVFSLGGVSSAASIGVGALGTSLNALGVAAGAALIPLGLLAAGVGLIALTKATADLKAFNDELENLQAGDNIASDNAAVLGIKLRKLNEERAKGIEIDEKKRQSFLKLSEAEIADQKQKLAANNALKPADDAQKRTQEASRIGIENTIKSLESQRAKLAENIAVTDQKAKSNLAIARSEKEVDEAIKKRIEKEKRGLEDRARISGRAFEQNAKGQKDTFEEKSRTDKRVFETQLNADKEAFEDAQKADKKKFEDEQKAETKRFTDAQKVDQKRFNAEEKASDKAYEREKQVAQRAFDKEQQAQKEAFDKKQREENLAFDKTQDAAKKTADTQFAQRRLEIERKLQLDAAKTPEDKAKLEAEFKAADEKAAKEKAAFAQLKADEEAFAEKQKADKIAFDEAQKAAQKAEDEKQKIAKQAFDDAQKLRDDEREVAKELRKDAFETQLNAKKEAFESALNAKKEAFDIAQAAKKQALDDEQNLKKQKFEDDERVKKAAFDDQQNAKKVAFEDFERAKKQAFEDNLKTLEAKFKADERAKDIATAQQVAAIKLGSSASAFNAGVGIATPRANGGSFRAGQQLLVGERGQELVTFGSGGYVSNATDTKQILSSNNKAPNSVSTARMEALLSQLVGKLDRPNVAITTSENPSDAYVKIQREAARADAMRSGI